MHTEQAVLSRRIVSEVGSWPGVESRDREDGTIAFSIGSREIGRLRSGRTAQFSFSAEVWSDLVGPEADCVSPSEDGCGTRPIENETDVREVIELLRLSYDRTVAAGRAQPSDAGPDRSRWWTPPWSFSCPGSRA